MDNGGVKGNSEIYPCAVCSFKVKGNLVLCVKCSKWIHCRYVPVKFFKEFCLREM